MFVCVCVWGGGGGGAEAMRTLLSRVKFSDM